MEVTAEQLSTIQCLLRFIRGTALFSNGYTIGAIGAVITLLTRAYPGSEFGTQYYSRWSASMVFAGIVSSMLFSGWFFNGIQAGMPFAPFGAIIVFMAYGAGASEEIRVSDWVRLLCYSRFILGVCAGGGHSIGSTFPNERWAKQDGIATNAQHRWFILGTKTMIDAGIVIAALVPLVLYWIFGEQDFQMICNISLCLGTIPAFVLLCEYMNFLYLLDDWNLSSTCLGYCRPLGDMYIPYSLTVKRYWKNVLGLSLAWFIYDLVMYPFGIYSSMVLNNITGGSSSLSIVLGWSVVINLFYIPGTVLGTFLIDYLGLKTTMIVGLLLQAATGFAMSIMCSQLTDHIAMFAVIYGIFLCFGEAGPGSCLRLLAGRTCPAAIDGQMYAIAATVGKLGAFMGIWVFPQIIEDLGGSNTVKGNTAPFWIGSSLAVLSAVVTFSLVKPFTRNTMLAEDKAFCWYLEENGIDVSHMSIQSSSEQGDA